MIGSKLFAKMLTRSGIIRGNMQRNDEIGALYKAWGHVFTNHIKGDYVEFGVYRGDSFVESYKNYLMFKNWLMDELQSSEQWRRDVAKNYSDFTPHFHGLDTFSGMPKNNEKNITFQEGTFFATKESVEELASYNGLPKECMTLYKGLFTDSEKDLKKNLSNQVAIVNIDGDLYESARDSLNIIKEHIIPGTVLLFDDYNAFNADNNKGERRAFKELREDFKYEFEPWFAYSFSGQSFLCIG